MRRILEELYFGNIVPSEKTFTKNSAYGKTLAAVDKNETYLNTVLEERAKEAFLAFVDAQAELNVIAGRENFMDGFRLGARIMLAVLCGEDGELRPLV